MPFGTVSSNFKSIVLLVSFVTIVVACSSKKEEQQIQQLLQQSDSTLWQSKSGARTYAEQAFDKAVTINNLNYKAQSLIRLANSVRVNTSLSVLLGYDSAAVATARQANDKTVLFEGLIAYAKDLTATNNVPKADTLLQEIEGLTDQLTDSIYKARYLQVSGLLNFKKFNIAKAKENFEASLQLVEKMGNGFLLASNKLNIFQANQYLGVYDTTGKEIFVAAGYFKTNHYPEAEANAWFSVGENYRYLGNIAKAQEYYYKANDIIVKHENYLMAGVFQNAVFLTMLSAGKLLEAKEAVSAMEKHFSGIDYEIGKGMAENYWGQYYTATGEFTLADKAFRQADSIADATGSLPLKTMNAMHKGVLLDKQHKAKESDSTVLLTLQSVQKMVAPQLIQNIYKDKKGNAFTDAEKKLYLDSAYLKDSGTAYFNTLRAQSDSAESPIYRPLLSSFDSSTAMSFSRQAAEIETQYKTRIISDSLQLQKQQTELNQSKLKTRNITLIATTALLLLVAIILYGQYRSRQRAVRDRQRIELLQNEIHHRVKNNLAVINRLVEVAGKNSVEDAPLAALKNRIKSIELLHNHLYSEKAQAGNIALQPYFEDLCLAVASTLGTTGKEVKIEVKAPAEVDSAIAEKLGLILNELVTNSYKYAFDGKDTGTIEVVAQPDGTTLHFTVKDNGKGMDAPGNNKSYGMKLIRGLSHELKGRFNFQNTNGTAFELIIPLQAA